VLGLLYEEEIGEIGEEGGLVWSTTAGVVEL